MPKADSFKRPLARLSKKKWEKIQISNIRNERGEIITDQKKRNIKEYYDQLYPHKLDNLEEWKIP